MFNYMIYLLAFAVGSILGLVYSYKLHGEPFVAVSQLNYKAAALSVIGWVLAFNTIGIILPAIGFLLAGFVMGERPGYGRKETAIGLIVSLAIYVILRWTVGGI